MNRAILAVSLWLLSPLSLAGTFEFQGQAIADNGDTLYTEHHRMQGECRAGVFQPTKHRVEYRDPDTSDTFANKELAFERSALMPVVDFSQPRFNERMDIRYREEKQVRIDWQTPEGGRERYSVGIPETLVVDSGFDHFIRQQWQRLNQGDKAEFRFLGPTRGDHFGFVAEPVSRSEINAHLVVRLRPTLSLIHI